MSCSTNYERFYNVLENAVSDLVKPNMVFTLSGGLDTRLIAGILAKIGADVPTVSYGDRMERLVSAKVADVLGLENFVFSQRYVKPALSKFLHDKGFRYVMYGTFFDEVNGDWAGHKAKTREQFQKACDRTMRVALASSEKNQRNALLQNVWPILDSRVQEALSQIPWQMRKGKQVQRYLLRTKFPKIWRILYYDSMLPPCFPFTVHSVSDIVVHRFGEFVAEPKLFMRKLLL